MISMGSDMRVIGSGVRQYRRGVYPPESVTQTGLCSTTSAVVTTFVTVNDGMTGVACQGSPPFLMDRVDAQETVVNTGR